MCRAHPRDILMMYINAMLFLMFLGPCGHVQLGHRGTTLSCPIHHQLLGHRCTWGGNSHSICTSLDPFKPVKPTNLAFLRIFYPYHRFQEAITLFFSVNFIWDTCSECGSVCECCFICSFQFLVN